MPFLLGCRRIIPGEYENMLPLKVIKGMLWYLGIPDDYLHNVERGLGECFKVVEMGDALKGLAVSNK